MVDQLVPTRRQVYKTGRKSTRRQVYKTGRMSRHFVVGENGGPSIRELGDDYRSRKISIRGLENVKDHLDVPEGILEDKENLKELKLEWELERDAGNSSEVKRVLERLQPHPHIECIKIVGYGGTEFPEWVGDASLPKLKKMLLSECENRIFLHPFGEFASLEELSINCPKLEVIWPEFYGTNQPRNKTFSSLKTLKFRDMKNWEEWNSSWDGAFPVLEELELCDCPKLTNLPEDLPSLERLRISGCRQLDFNNLLTTSRHLGTINIGGSENVEFLSSRTWFFGTHFSSSLTSLTVWGCSELETFPGGQCSCPSLEELELGDCSELESVHIGLPSLKRLRISGCRQLDFNNLLTTSRHLETINIRGSENVELLSSLTWFFSPDFSSSLTSFTLWGCSELEAFPGGQCSCPSLEELELGDCPELKSVHIDLPRLKRLRISGCRQLDFENLIDMSAALETIDIQHSEKKCMSLARKFRLEGLHYFSSSLEELVLDHCPELRYVFSGLPSLKRLRITGCGRVNFDDLIKCDALETIDIRDSEKKCMSLASNMSLASKSHLKELLYFSSSLEKLELRDCPKLMSLRSDLPSLKELRITDCGQLEFLTIGVSLSAPNLTSITIRECSKLETFGRELDSCPCLQELELINCPKLMSVPSNLPSLKQLQMKGCGELDLKYVLISACAALETIDIYDCEKVTCIPLETFPKLKVLDISYFWNLESLGPIATTTGTSDPLPCPFLTSLSISHCFKLVSFPRGGLDAPNLKSMVLWDCRELKLLPQGMHQLLTSLEELSISECPKIKSLPDGGLPSSLSVPRIKDCPSLENWCETNGILFRYETLIE